ncbi:Hsp20/alpha crystallin family protein [Pelotomaculum isophthalicicum JI]|uniref:Hsp20/alpha crystallin family protein n=1 Tax=Pelotomaculum isophthalicicum JI TaxID=947010 RepID=A0A9X4H1A8_9FIRM|nr:Hsp20/alpha crystallin family protein [Pelotomaculum isophthalicicum]MDF9407986.1 Hsp20/alpha crystallin family protein [Pelotomaculum isophthalicicum JI]
MNSADKNWFKLALDLYEKTKGMNVYGNLNKDVLDHLMEIANHIAFPNLNTAQSEKEIKVEQAVSSTPVKAEDNIVWQEGSAASYDLASTTDTIKGGYTPPISIYETPREVNVSAILPGIASRNNLNVLLSQETLELSGTRDVIETSGNKIENKRFFKTIRLPALVEPSGATATYHNGFLYVKAPKKNRSSQNITVKFE